MPARISYTEWEYATSYPSQRKVVRLPDGTLYAAYYKLVEYLTISNYKIYVKKSNDNGLTWATEETKISTAPGMENYHQLYPSIAVDSNNNLHVVWHGRATGYTTYYQIWYAKFDGNSWSTPVRISTYSGMEGYHQSNPSIAVGLDNNLHVVWYGCATGYTTYYQIWYAKFDGNSWSTPVRISTYNGMATNSQYYPAIVVDSSNYLHVVWNGMATGYTTVDQIWYNKYTTSWAGPVRISDYSGMENSSNYRPSIVVDSNDYLHVVWAGQATGYTVDQIWYNKYTTSWAGPVRISDYSGMESYHQFRPSMTVDSFNNLHVIWYGMATGYTDYTKIWYAKYITSWITPECLQATGQNRHPVARWSRYPSCNIPYAGVDYVFTEGTATPWEVYSDKKGDPFPPAPIPNPLVCKVLVRKH
ncbi:hypothetical protein ES708_17625 [subsurface metagenome]